MHSAVDAQEKESHDVDLANLLTGDLECTAKIGPYWDTLGWVHFRLGHLDQAESYLRAAWLLSQYAVIADHQQFFFFFLLPVLRSASSQFFGQQQFIDPSFR